MIRRRDWTSGWITAGIPPIITGIIICILACAGHLTVFTVPIITGTALTTYHATQILSRFYLRCFANFYLLSKRFFKQIS